MVPVCDFFSYFYGSLLLANQANLAKQVTSKFFKFKLLQYEKYKKQTIKNNHNVKTINKPNLTIKQTTTDFQFQLTSKL